MLASLNITIREACCVLHVVISSSKGLSSTYVSSELTDCASIDAVSEGMYHLVLFIPEMIIKNKIWRRVIQDVYANRPKAFVIDEAHCVKKW